MKRRYIEKKDINKLMENANIIEIMMSLGKAPIVTDNTNKSTELEQFKELRLQDLKTVYNLIKDNNRRDLVTKSNEIYVNTNLRASVMKHDGDVDCIHIKLYRR